MICNTWLPINKHLWTDSFALFMAGLDFIVFAIFVWCVDGLGYKRVVKPFVIMGMNAIAIYMVSELLATVLSAIHVTSGDSIITLHHWIFATIFAPARISCEFFAALCACLYRHDVPARVRPVPETLVLESLNGPD